MDGAGHPFSEVQVSGRNGTGVALEQGSGALRVKTSSKGPRLVGLGCTTWICSFRSAQVSTLGLWVLLVTFRAGLPDAVLTTPGPVIAKSSELGVKKLRFSFYATVN